MRQFSILVGICALLIQSGCSPRETHHEEALKLQVTSPLRENTSITRPYVSQIRSIQHIELRALEKGYVQEVFMDEGQVVKEGQMLFQIMPQMYNAELNKAHAEFEFAEIEYENTERLKKDNVIAPSELNLAKAKLDQAQAELALAQVHVDFTKVQAPFNGISGRLHVRKGSLVEEGELLTTLSDNSSMWVYFNMPEAEYLEFQRRVGTNHETEVELMMANHELYQHPGKITAIEADFNNETGNIAFRATFPNPEGILRHGQTGTVLLKTPLDDALLIPQKATFEILDKRYVFVVDKRNKIRSKPISVVAEMPDLFAIGDELSEKNTILLEGLRKVRDGDSIVPDIKEPKAVLASLKVYAE
ncbi:MAG: efflux RND transporter periplasmic adaptor subunit [Bdellovibrionales bacterium]|nr:efflux RND transporter periplasmic adaptor subunit [Bdellovibrionales bacterium]